MQIAAASLVWIASVSVLYVLVTRAARSDAERLSDLLRAQHKQLERALRSFGAPQASHAHARHAPPAAPRTAPEDQVARLLLERAEQLRRAKQFADAAGLYRELVARFPASKHADAARTQIASLRRPF